MPHLLIVNICFILALCFSFLWQPSADADLNTCLLCSQQPDKSYDIAGAENVCEDLFKSACLRVDGTDKYRGERARRVQFIQEKIDKIRDSAVRTLGFTTFDQALLNEFKKNGLVVKQNPDSDSLADLKKSGRFSHQFGLFQASFDCENDVNLGMSLLDLKKKYQDIYIKYRGLDFSTAFNEASRACESIAMTQRESCLKELKAQFISIYRKQPSQEFDNEVRRFIEHRLPLEPNQVCAKLRDAEYGYGEVVATKFMTEVNKSKPMINGLFEEFYSKSQIDAGDKYLRLIKDDIKDFANQFIQTPSKRQRVISEYDKMNILWPKIPSADKYSRGDSGLLILDDKKNVSLGLGVELSIILSDPSLGHFKEANSNYLPFESRGVFKEQEGVRLFPEYTLPMVSDPYFSLALVAHEAAHKIGPRISYINNYDLQRSYAQLLDCYRDPRSLGPLVNNQTQDEIVADYISSEVVARELAQIPEHQRKPALLAVMKNYCLWEEDQGGFLNIKAVHPPNELRISAIFGANPNLRSLIGCKKDSLSYKSCGVKNFIQIKKEPKDKSSKYIDRAGVQ